MARGVTFTAREKEVLREIMLSAWARKRGGRPATKRMRFNPKGRRR